MGLFGWGKEQQAEGTVPTVGASADALLQALDAAIPDYLGKADRGELVYPACKRTSTDVEGGARDIWQHTRLEALRYLTMIPGRESALLTSPTRQADMMDVYLRLQPHEKIVIEFTGRAADNIAIAIVAGLNWLNHCAILAKVDRARASGTLRNFRKAVTLAQQWWALDGALARCSELQEKKLLPPLMLNLVFLEFTHVAKEIAAAAAFDATDKDGSGNADAVRERFAAALDPDELSAKP